MRKKILTGIFAIGVICLFLACAYGDGYFIMCRPGSVVNVRTKPEKGACVSAWLECGKKITTDGEEKNGYIHVIDLAAEESDGWVYSGYVVDDVPRIRTYKARVDGRVIARKSVDGKRVRILYDGQTVTVYVRTGMWAVTSKGFVMCDWLEEIYE